MIRVLIVDDHPAMRRGLSELLASHDDLEVVGTAAAGEEALLLAIATSPDVVLMDISMPGMDGTEAAVQLLRSRPLSRVVMLTSFSEHERVMDSLDAGAIGYLTKDATPDEIVSGVRAAARGESPLSPKAAAAVLKARTRRRPVDDLTPREIEVLQLLSRGLANKQIAWRMGITEKTVKAHLTNVFQRIGVTDRTQAALWARDNGLAQTEGS